MGRSGKDIDQGFQPLSGKMEDIQGRISKGDHGCVLRSEDPEDCLHDGKPVGKDRVHEFHPGFFHNPRPMPGSGPSTNPGNGKGLESGQTGSDDSNNSSPGRTNIRSEGKGWRQYHNPETVQERGKAIDSRVKLSSESGKQTDQGCSDGRSGQDAPVSRDRRKPDSVGNQEDRELLQPKNFSLFDSYSKRGIRYRDSIPGIRSEILLPEMSEVQSLPDPDLVQDQVAPI